MVRRPLAVIAALCGGMLASAAAFAKVTATVEPPVIDELESARLVLHVEGAGDGGSLDTGPLEAAFEVLNQSTQSQINIVNGRMQSWVEHHLELRPKRTGVLEVPPLAVGGERSPALRLRVNALSAEARNAIDRMIFFKVEAAPNPVRVQAQTLLIRRLFYAPGVQVYSDLPGAPEVADAVVIPLGDNNAANQVLNGRPYGLFEQRYALFPEKSGALRIPGASVVSSAPLAGRGGRRSGIRVQAAETTVEVLPAPAAYPAGQPWLAAQEVSVLEAWEPPNPAFKVGEPLRRVITINAVGNTSSAIPPLTPNLPEAFFKQYPEPERLEDAKSSTGVLGMRRQAYSIIPTQPGASTLPALALTWWDSANEQVRKAVLPARPVNIVGEPPTPADAPSPALRPQQAEAETAQALSPAAEQAQPAGPTLGGQPPWAWALAAMGFIGWAATWAALRRQRPASSKRRRAAAQKAAVGQARKALAKACREEHCEAMRSAWLACLGAFWGTSAADTLARVKDDAEAKEMLNRLNATLYADAQSAPIDGQALLRLTSKLLNEDADEQAAILPELHGFAPSKAPKAV